MSETAKGMVAMLAACTCWGLTSIYLDLLSHIPAHEVLAYRAIWSLPFFMGLLAFQGRFDELRAVTRLGRRGWLVVLAAAMVASNWFLFILSIQIGHATEASLGYYIYPLIAVMIGRFAFGETLGGLKKLAILSALVAVITLTVGLGHLPWVAVMIAGTFALYGVIKKFLPLGPVASVTAEMLVFLPVALLILLIAGGPLLGGSLRDAALLIGSGPITALPLVLFSYAAPRIAISTAGVLFYLNPTLQFLAAVLVLGEVLQPVHTIAFPLIWLAVALYSFAALRQDRAVRKAAIAASGVSTHVRNAPSEASAKP